MSGPPADPGWLDSPVDWTAAARDVHWFTKPSGPNPASAAADPLEASRGGVLNLCFNALDRHVALGRADETALVAVTGAGVSELSYARLLEKVAKVAGILRALGATAGDRVLLVLPPGVEAVVTALACARLGCWSENATATSPDGLLLRLTTTEPLVVVASSSSLPAVRSALERSAHQPVRTIAVREPGADPLDEAYLDFALLLRSTAVQPTECVALAAASRVSLGPALLGPYTLALRWAAVAALGLAPGTALAITGTVDPSAQFAAGVLAPLLVGGVVELGTARSSSHGTERVLISDQASVPAALSAGARSVFVAAPASPDDDLEPGRTVPTGAAVAHRWRPPTGWPATQGVLDRPAVRYVSPQRGRSAGPAESGIDAVR